MIPAGWVLVDGGELFFIKTLSSVIVHRFASPLFLDQPFASPLISLSPLYSLVILSPLFFLDHHSFAKIVTSAFTF